VSGGQTLEQEAKVDEVAAKSVPGSVIAARTRSWVATGTSKGSSVLVPLAMHGKVVLKMGQ
jgi:hypothetical protein